MMTKNRLLELSLKKQKKKQDKKTPVTMKEKENNQPTTCDQ